MNFTEGKNYKVINPFAISYILINPHLGKDFSMQIFGGFDLCVDNTITESPEEFWVVLRDLDGVTFAQPMDASILAQKIMSGGWLPLSIYEKLKEVLPT